MNNTINQSRHFHNTIEQMVTTSGVSHFDAVVDYINRQPIELETVASYIKRSPALKAKIEAECGELNLLVSTTHPVDYSEDDDNSI